MEDCFQSDPSLDKRHDTPHMYITLDWIASKYFFMHFKILYSKFEVLI